jgi:hypothetical protein
MHSDRLVNHLDPLTRAKKKITDKARNMTDDDREEVSRLEFLGGLYYEPDIGPYLPGPNVQKCLLETARASRKGKKIERGVFITTSVNPLSYSGPRDPDELWKDKNFVYMHTVKQGKGRIVRCRPMFRQWKADAEGDLDTEQINWDQFVDIAETAGQITGLGDWRPTYGRFTAVVEKISG